METHDVSDGCGMRNKNLLVCISYFTPLKHLVLQSSSSKPVLLLIPCDIAACAYSDSLCQNSCKLFYKYRLLCRGVIVFIMGEHLRPVHIGAQLYLSSAIN